MKNTNIKLLDATIHPGENLSLALPLPELHSCAPMYMPIKIIHGKQAGPCLLVTATMNGNELNGIEIINRLIDMSLMKRLKGTLIAVPVLNVYGLINRSRHLPGGYELNRSFPGAKTGNLAARLAHIISNELLDKANYHIDLQTGFLNYSNLPQTYINFKDEKAKKLAEAFGAPVISNINIEKGSLAEITASKSIPLLSYEAGEAMRFDEHAIKIGLKGILNVMRELNMLPELNEATKLLRSFYTEGNVWVRASASGISHTKIKLGKHVAENETLCVIKDPFGASDSTIIKCPREAIVVGKNNLPLVHEGEALFQIAVFKGMKETASHLTEWEARSTEHLKDIELIS